MSYLIKTIYRFGFWYINDYIASLNHIVMSRELLEFSELIDEQFEPADIETDELLEYVLGLFE
ncbi:hypothetical protein BH09BAC6_BH09BAC6_26950 [soil metagenome]|jgi:hypothetical protein